MHLRMGKILSMKNCHCLPSASIKVSMKESTADFILFIFYSIPHTSSYIVCLLISGTPSCFSIHFPQLWRICHLWDKKNWLEFQHSKTIILLLELLGSLAFGCMPSSMWVSGKVVSEMPQEYLYSGLSHMSIPFADICVQCCSHSRRGCTSCPTICQWGATSPSLSISSRGCDAQSLRWRTDSFPR